MGKTKNKRHKNAKPNPTGLPSVRDIEKEEEDLGASGDCVMLRNHASDSANILSITEKLQGVNVEDKECGCCNIAALVEDKASLSTLLEHGIVRHLGPLLVDPSFVVRHAASGALRNMSACGDPEVCDAMLEQDIMTPLVALFKQTRDSWTPSKKKENKIDTKVEILIEATHLLWNLCESNSIALHIFNREELVPILLQFLNPAHHGSDLAIAVAQCIHTASEDNRDAIELFGRPGLMEPVEALVRLEGDGSDVALLRILGAGILLNLHEGRLLLCSSALVSGILKILTHTLSVDITAAVVELANKLTARKSQARRRKNEEDELGAQDVEITSSKKELDNLLSAAIYALEMLTNICCSDDGTGDWEDMDSSDASDEIFCPDATMDCDVSNEKFPLSIPSEIHEAILSHNVVTKVLNKIIPFTNDSCTSLQTTAKSGQAILKRLCTLQCRSLLCIHNVVSCLDVEELGGPSAVHSIWLNLAQIAFKHTCVCPADSQNPLFCNTVEHVEFLEAVTRAMRGVLQKLTQVKTPLMDQLSPSDVQLMCEVAELCTDTSVRTNIINIIGTIGNMLSLSQDPAAINTIKGMGIFLLELCSKDTELTVTAEALDAIFDVFAEDHLDSIARDINLVERLKQVLPSLKSKIHSQRKVLGEHYPIVMTAKTNLVRFIRYKTEMQATNGHQQSAG